MTHSKLNNILYNKSTFPMHLLLLYLLFIYSIILFVSVSLSLDVRVCAQWTSMVTLKTSTCLNE